MASAQAGVDIEDALRGTGGTTPPQAHRGGKFYLAICRRGQSTGKSSLVSGPRARCAQVEADPRAGTTTLDIQHVTAGRRRQWRRRYAIADLPGFQPGMKTISEAWKKLACVLTWWCSSCDGRPDRRSRQYEELDRLQGPRKSLSWSWHVNKADRFDT